MLISINIVAYNEENNIEKSLSSALAQSYSPIEVFLVDNASKDKTVRRAEEIYKKSVTAARFRIIRNERNLGFGGGHNVGFENSKGDLVLCLNADCALDKNYVKYAVDAFRRDGAIGAVQGKLINPRTGKLDTAGFLFFKNRRVINRGQGEDDTGQYENYEEIWGVDGAAPMYRREMLEDIKVPFKESASKGVYLSEERETLPLTKGESRASQREGRGFEYFDEDFFAYKEDIDLCWRMRWAGWRCVYEPKSVGYHDRSAGEGTAKNPLEIVQARRKVGSFAKYHSFANQRLMQIKNETVSLISPDIPSIFVKELMSWPYALLFERHGYKSAYKFFKLLKKTIRKRQYVMAKRRISDEAMRKWFL